MTREQAHAILQAERVLQEVGCDGPDLYPGSPWFNYIKDAIRTLGEGCTEYAGLVTVQDLKDLGV